jgi:transposase-like protein
MSKKRTTYSSAFKTKLVLELLQNESTLAEIASKHNILPQNLVNWKKAPLTNAEIAMEPSKAVKEYKEELIKSQEQNERLTALVGKVTVEKEWLAKKLKSLGSSKLKQLVDLRPSSASISINHQCQLLGINRGTSHELIMSGVLTSATSRLPVAWSIWQPSLTGTAKLCYHTEYLTP